MELSRACSNKTVLSDRVVYHDGDIEISAADATSFILRHPNVKFFVDKITPEIDRFNQMAPSDKKISIKTGVREPDLEWKIPLEYHYLDIESRILNRLSLENLDDDDLVPRIVRTRTEMAIFKRLDLIPFLRVMCYAVDTLDESGVIWGVGRGSSVASYVLYLIGIHDVDSVKYDLDFREFIKNS